MLADRLHGTDSVGDHAPVVVRPRVEDPAGHEPGMGRRPRAVRVGRVADHPGRALAARIHDEMGEPGGCPADALMGESPAAAVADVLDDPGERLRRGSRKVQPATHRRAAEPGERDVEGPDDRQPAVDRRERRRGRVRSRLAQCLVPERVEVGRHREVRPVGAQLVDGEIRIRHDAILQNGPCAVALRMRHRPPTVRRPSLPARRLSGEGVERVALGQTRDLDFVDPGASQLRAGTARSGTCTVSAFRHPAGPDRTSLDPGSGGAGRRARPPAHRRSAPRSTRRRSRRCRSRRTRSRRRVVRSQGGGWSPVPPGYGSR